MNTRRCRTLLERRSFVRACVASILTAVALCASGCARPGDSPAQKSGGLRVVTTAPSITETFFALGLGDYVVGVSDYCKYPPEAKEREKIGSLYEYNAEKIVELNPDFVVVLKENEVLPPRMERLGVEVVVVDHTSLEGVLTSFEELGARVDRELGEGSNVAERGRELRKEMEARIESVRERTKELPRPRALVSIYRTLGAGKIGEVYVAGHNPFFNAVLEIVNCENVAKELPGVAPTTNAEGIASLNPEIILDLSTDGQEYDAETRARVGAERTADWSSLGSEVDAVRTGRICQIFDDYATVPGPRAVQFIEDLAPMIHPELATAQ